MTGRGATLVELMIAVAILGITLGAAGVTGSHQRAGAAAELQRTRAQLLLEYRAECLVAGRAPTAETEQKLAEGLPQLALNVAWRGKAATVVASWRSASGAREEASLTVLTRGVSR